MPTTKTILVVEDDQAIRDMIKMLLTTHQYHVLEAPDYHTALKLSQSSSFHLVLLDWMLPDGNGLTLIKALKKQDHTQHIPIIMLTAKQHEEDQILGLDAGADDYITKPFSAKNLLARINAILRRALPNNDQQLQIADLAIDLQSHRVSAGGQELVLGPTEYKLLVLFMHKPERVFSRDQLIDHIWGNDTYIDDRTIDVHIGRLRKQLEKTHHHKFIQTVRGAGYRFSAQAIK